MKRRNTFYLGIVFLTALWACKTETAADGPISGTLRGAKGMVLYFEELGPNGVELIDSAVVDANDGFCLTKPARGVNFYQLRLGPNQAVPAMQMPTNICPIITDSTEKIVLEIDPRFMARPIRVEGSPETMLLNEIFRMVESFSRIQDSLNRQMQSSGLTQQAMIQQNNQAWEQYRMEIIAWVRAHLGAFSTLQAINYLNVDDANNLSLFKEVLDALISRFPNNFRVQNFNTQVSMKLALAPGKTAPNFTLPSSKGDTLSLSDFYGKHTLILVDFWASWCAPCRAENPNLRAAYAKYRSKGFEIVAVSLDQNKEAWLRGIKEDKLSWPQLSDLGYFNSEAARLYGINSIPANFLLDANGVILASNLRGPELNSAIEEHLP
jgi:peroxiredoxin